MPVGARPARRRVDRHVTVRVRYLDRDGVAHDEVKRGLTAGTFQHECDHLDGRLFLDRVTDPTTFTTWEQFERFHRDAFVERITEFVGAGRVLTVTGAPCSTASCAWLGGDDGRGRRAARASTATASPRSRRACPPPAAPTRLRRAHAARASPTPTATPSTGPCAAGRSAGGGSFWTWREQMYELAARARPRQLPPPGARRLRRDGAGRHHQRRRVPLPPPRPGRRAVRRPERDGRGAARGGGRRRGHPHHAARHVLPPRRLRRRRPKAVQRRFSDGDADAWAERATRARARLADRPRSAPPSTRCGPSTPPAHRGRGRRGRRSGGRRSTPTCPSSRPRTTRCLAAPRLHPDGAAGRRRRAGGPVHGGPRHPRRPTTTSPCSASAAATVLPVPHDRARPGRRHRPGGRGSPTPEPALSLGTDSHAVVDLFEEARAVELHERLRDAASGTPSAPPTLLRAATADGHRSLGWPEAGTLRPGALADLVTVGLDTVRTGRAPTPTTPSTPPCSPRPPPTCDHVVVGGAVVVRRRRHVARSTCAASWPPRCGTRPWCDAT